MSFTLWLALRLTQILAAALPKVQRRRDVDCSNTKPVRTRSCAVDAKPNGWKFSAPAQPRLELKRSVECCRGRGWLTLLLLFRWGRTVFLIFLCCRHHFYHPFLDLVDLGVHFLDEVMFDLGQLFNSFALLTKLFQKIILFG